MGATELTACLHQYGLQASGPARLLPGGHVGQSAVVPTAQGLLVVKRCNRRFERARVQLAAQTHQHAARAGFAPPLRLTLDGQWTAQVDDATYTVTEYVDHAEQAGPPTALASALAALHNRFESFSPQGHCEDFLQLPDPPAADLERIRRQTHDAASRHAIDWRMKILAEFGLDAQSLAAVPRSWVHGDARPDNLLIAHSPDRRLFIDFDQVSRFPRPYEIVRAFVACIPQLSSHLLGSTFREYLNAYHAVAPIPTTDRAIMVDLYITVQAAETRTFTTPQGEIRDMPAFARARHQQLTWITENCDLLRRVAEEAQP
ncbi:phosphotransferase [Streptomyces sp. NPDC056580]|uniref:phosphotransferase n=1 Tax=Streptomyces sp. NPDC056580 TaxID=3345872 RepID=UPI0036953D56